MNTGMAKWYKQMCWWKEEKTLHSLLLGMDPMTYELWSINPIHSTNSPCSLIELVEKVVCWRMNWTAELGSSAVKILAWKGKAKKERNKSWKILQPGVFLVGHTSKYYPHQTGLNFGDWKFPASGPYWQPCHQHLQGPSREILLHFQMDMVISEDLRQFDKLPFYLILLYSYF